MNGNKRTAGRMPMTGMVVAFCALAVTCLASAGNVFAENSDYQPPTNFPQGENRAEEITVNNIKRSYQLFNQFKKQHGESISSIPKLRGKERQLYGHQAPAQHPLDKYDGHLPNPVSWLEYITDSVTILQRETFNSCLEPRAVVEKVGATIVPHDLANAPAFAVACMINCPSIDNPFPFNLTLLKQDWKVHSYYWPQNQVSVNKAGAQMIDPTMFGEQYGSKLSRSVTQQTEKNGNENGENELNAYIKSMGIDTSVFKDLPKRVPGEELFLQDDWTSADDAIRFPGAMRPNAFWRAANARPRSQAGYSVNDRCLFDALDPPTKDNKIVSYRYDQGMFGLFARYPELRAIVDKKRYSATTIPSRTIREAAEDESYKTNLCASYRMQQLGDLYTGLKRVGFSAGGSKPTHMDYCMPGGGELSGSMTANAYLPELQADALRAAMGMVVFGSQPMLRALAGQSRGGLSATGLNDDELRVNQFTLFRERHSKNRPRYYANGVAMQPFGQQQPIVFLDKMQRIFPRQPLANADGRGGSALNSVYADAGAGSAQAIVEFAKARAMVTRGSHCFRPEDVPNWSGEDRFSKEEFPLGLSLDAFKHYGETRWAFYNRRIVCSCEVSSWPLGTGCLSVNHGDNEEDSFAGGLPLPTLPPPFEKAIPEIDKLAVEIGGS